MEYLDSGAPITEGLVREIHKRLFTISEYYDRDRAAFYAAIQGVRDRGMDLTGWLDYFVQGLAAQLGEVSERGKKAMKADYVLKGNKL